MFGKTKSSRAKKAPISAHPVFPIVVAAWFAALLGLGSLILPSALLETLVSATGISAIISAAEPPLGTTARILIAVIAGLVGAIAGLFIARKVVAAQAESGAAEDEASDIVFGEEGPVKKPISAHEELGSERLDDPIEDRAEDAAPANEQSTDAPAMQGRRRRGLTVSADTGMSEMAPLPVAEELDNEPVPEFSAPINELNEEPLVLGEDGDTEEEVDSEEEFAADSFALPFVNDEPSEDETAALLTEDFLAEDTAEDIHHDAEPARPFDAPMQAMQSEGAAGHFESDVMDEADEETIAMAKFDNSAAASAYNPLSAQAADFEPEANPFANEDNDAPAVSSADAPAASTVTSAEAALMGKSLQELGMVELVERFALALQNGPEPEQAAYTSEGVDADAPIEQTQEPTPTTFEHATPVVEEVQDGPELIQASSSHEDEVAPDSKPQAQPSVPLSMQPIAFDEDEEEDEDGIGDFGLPLQASNFSADPAVPSVLDADDFEEEGEPEEDNASNSKAYSSLLSMKGPFSTLHDDEESPEETEDESVPSDGTMTERPFDAPEPTLQAVPKDSAETERALREALEKLQRMSGAA